MPVLSDREKSDIPHFLSLIREEFSYYLPLDETPHGRLDHLATLIKLSYNNIYTNLRWLWKHAETKTTPYDVLLSTCRIILEAEANLYYILTSKNAKRLAATFTKSFHEVTSCHTTDEFEQKMSNARLSKLSKFDDSTTTDRIQHLLGASFAQVPFWTFNNCNFFVHSSAYDMWLADFFKDHPEFKTLPLLLTSDLVRLFPCIFLFQDSCEQVKNPAMLVVMEMASIYAARDPESNKMLAKIYEKMQQGEE